jgi:hypothetical protein
MLVCVRYETEPKRVLVIQAVSGISGDAVEETAAKYVGCNVVEQHVAHKVGDEVEIAVAVIIRELDVEIVDGPLPSHRTESVLLVLILINRSRIAVCDAPGCESARRNTWAGASACEAQRVERLPWIVRDLEFLVRHAHDRHHAGGRIEQRRGVFEQPARTRLIVKRLECWGWVLEAFVAPQKTSG